jgi:ADP-ribose pyrophosphatase YjhB (NUDIX family)
MEKGGHCAYCGAPFAPETNWPRVCSVCKNVSFQNPIPVTIVLLPVDKGVLVVRRAILPHAGELALPGGYIDLGETWQEAGAREVYEEAGVIIDPDSLRPIEVYSASDGTLVIAAVGPFLSGDDLPIFAPNAESSARMILTKPARLAFELHTELVARFLSGQPLGYQVQHPHI